MNVPRLLMLTLLVAGLLLAFGVFAPSGCGRSAPVVEEKPVIVVSIHPLADVVKQLVGDRAEVVQVLPVGESPWGFEPTAEQTEAIDGASLVVMVGGPVDDWMNQAFSTRRQRDSLRLVFAHEIGAGGPSDEVIGAARPAYPRDNPHLWLDPVLMRQFVGKLTERLVTVMVEDSTAIQRNAVTLDKLLKSLDEDYRATLGEGLRQHQFVATTDAFAITVGRYGATLTPITPRGARGQVSEASFERAAEVVREHELPVVYAEMSMPRAPAADLADLTAAQLRVLDPLGEQSQSQGIGYIGVMRYNLEQLRAGMVRD